MSKISHANDIADHISLVYAKIETKLSGPIEPGLVYDENQTG